jgi:hypothetical protein
MKKTFFLLLLSCLLLAGCGYMTPERKADQIMQCTNAGMKAEEFEFLFIYSSISCLPTQ